MDTNVIFELVKAKPEAKVVNWVRRIDEDALFLSVLTLGEMRKCIAEVTSGAGRAKLEMWLDTELRARFAGRFLPVDEEVADRWGTTPVVMARTGKPLPMIDGLMVATASRYNLVFVTRNTADFAGTGVPCLDPWLP